MRERNALLGELPPEDIRLLLRWRFLLHMTGFLTTELFGPAAALNEAFSGQSVTPPRKQLVTNKVKSLMGHPISQVYVDKYFYDADGVLRDWWSEEDATNLLARAGVLIAQANAYEVLPGLHINGELTVANEEHADGNYRVEAPIRHIDGYYEAFPAGAEDYMWIAPEERARIW